MKRILQVLGLAVLLAGCAGGATRRDSAAKLNDYVVYAGAPVDSFHFFNRLDNWQAVGPTQVVIWPTAFDAYLVTVQTPCPELQNTDRLGVTSTGGTVSKFESLIVRYQQRCPVVQIRPIDLKQMKADRAAERAADKANAASQSH